MAQELLILREWLDILEEFEIAMDGNEWLVTFHQSLIFPVPRWVRSVLIGLAEGGDWVPSEIKAELFHTFGISGTDIMENSINWLREKARCDKAEKQSPMTQWQRTMALSRYGCAETHHGIRLVLPTGQKVLPHLSNTDTFEPTSHKESTRR